MDQQAWNFVFVVSGVLLGWIGQASSQRSTESFDVHTRLLESRRAAYAELIAAVNEFTNVHEAISWHQAAVTSPDEDPTDHEMRSLTAAGRMNAAVAQIELLCPDDTHDAAGRWVNKAFELVEAGLDAPPPDHPMRLERVAIRAEFVALAKRDLAEARPRDGLLAKLVPQALAR